MLIVPAVAGALVFRRITFMIDGSIETELTKVRGLQGPCERHGPADEDRVACHAGVGGGAGVGARQRDERREGEDDECRSQRETGRRRTGTTTLASPRETRDVASGPVRYRRLLGFWAVETPARVN